MTKTIQGEQQKEFTITNEELSELSFDAQQFKARQTEMEFWGLTMKQLQNRIAQRLALKETEFRLDWSNIFPDGKLKAIKVPQVKVEVNPTEKKDDSNPPKTADN